MAGEPISLPMAHLLESSGVYSAEFVARQITSTHLRDADLVLGMTGRHRTATLELHPAATKRTFTLREFARLAVLVDKTGGPAEHAAFALLRRHVEGS